MSISSTAHPSQIPYPTSQHLQNALLTYHRPRACAPPSRLCRHNLQHHNHHLHRHPDKDSHHLPSPLRDIHLGHELHLFDRRINRFRNTDQDRASTQRERDSNRDDTASELHGSWQQHERSVRRCVELGSYGGGGDAVDVSSTDHLFPPCIPRTLRCDHHYTRSSLTYCIYTPAPFDATSTSFFHGSIVSFPPHGLLERWTFTTYCLRRCIAFCALPSIRLPWYLASIFDLRFWIASCFGFDSQIPRYRTSPLPFSLRLVCASSMLFYSFSRSLVDRSRGYVGGCGWRSPACSFGIDWMDGFGGDLGWWTVVMSGLDPSVIYSPLAGLRYRGFFGWIGIFAFDI